MLRKSNMFNSNSICIFTDASYRAYEKNSGIGTTCSAVCVYNNDVLIDQYYEILENSTAQQGELNALLMASNIIGKYKNFKHIRIFSDSQTSIFALRDRIFNWIYKQNRYGGILDENGEIKNVDYIVDIIANIMTTNVGIELYHVKGHVILHDPASLNNAKKVFALSNNINPNYIDNEFIYQLAVCNNQVDKFSRYMLNNDTGYVQKINAIHFDYGFIDPKHYRNLIRR
jgi:ribonuclease H